MDIEELKRTFPETWEKSIQSVGYCYITYCEDTHEFYIGKKQSKKFIDIYYGSGAVVKRWKRLHYQLQHWPIAWANTIYDLLQCEYSLVERAKQFSNCANMFAGGSPAMTNKKHSMETIQKMREAALKRKHAPLSEETKRKISESNKGKHNKSEEQRKAVGDFHRGRKRSAETCEKISQSKSGSNNPNFGKSMSEETKKKISQSQKGRQFTPEHKEKLRQSRLNFLSKKREENTDG